MTNDILLVVMRNHIGKANGIKAADLVKKINTHAMSPICTERGLRGVVEGMREEGHHICAHPRDGYFIAENEVELEETIVFLLSRAMRTMKQVSAMRRISLPTLFGQMNLPT